MGADATVYDEIDPSVTTEFVGYDKLETASTVTVLTTETEIVEALSDGEIGTIIVEETPFYATMGGQQGDKGVIYTADGDIQSGRYDQVIRWKSGTCRQNDKRHDQSPVIKLHYQLTQIFVARHVRTILQHTYYRKHSVKY